jgi:acetoin utilization protein AcuB
MRLADIMSTPVETIETDVPVETAWNRMQERGIHHLVVTQSGKAVGILSARDLSGPRGVALRWAGTAGELMATRIVTAEPTMTVREAANLLRGRAIGCLPVVSGERIVGIVTITDLLEMIGRGQEKLVTRKERRTLTRAELFRKSPTFTAGARPKPRGGQARSPR